MRLDEFVNKSKPVNGQNKTYYKIINDLGTCYGSIVNNFRIWLENDLKQIGCKTKYTYISNHFVGMNDFYFTEGMLMQIEKPNLSLQFNINHTDVNASFDVPALNNFEAVNVLKSKQFTDSIISAAENNNSIDIRLSFKAIKVEAIAGLVFQSRYYADNIAQAWNVKRRDGYTFSSKFLVDFQIPDYVIEMLYKKFNISKSSHRPMLRWLNKHTMYPVYYGLNTFNAKPGFFIKLKTKPHIRATGMTNPQGISEMNYNLEMWTMTRNFEVDIVVPTMIAITGYINPEINIYDNTNGLDNDITDFLNNERFEEYNLQINDKHALMSSTISLDNNDITELKSGKRLSKKIYIADIVKADGRFYPFIEWGLKNGYDLSDMLDFVIKKPLMEGLPYTRLGKGHTVSDAITKLGMTLNEYKGYVREYDILLKTDDERLLTIDDLDIPLEDYEYDNYIKNTKELWFIDLDPSTDRDYEITFYVSMRLFNKYTMDTKEGLEDYISSDDMSQHFPQGSGKELNDIQNRY